MKLLKRLLRIRASFTVFLLFFGISMFEAFRTRTWINVVFWVAVGLMFLMADGFKFRKLAHKEDESLKLKTNEI